MDPCTDGLILCRCLKDLRGFLPQPYSRLEAPTANVKCVILATLGCLRAAFSHKERLEVMPGFLNEPKDPHNAPLLQQLFDLIQTGEHRLLSHLCREL